MTGGQSAVRMNGRRSFPVGGLVELSRATYQSTPLAVVEIRPTVFSFIRAGGTVTAVGGSQECAVIDTGYGPRVQGAPGSNPGTPTIHNPSDPSGNLANVGSSSTAIAVI